jgi:hypothetical protein
MDRYVNPRTALEFPIVSVGALTATAIGGGALVIAWTWWGDRHRIPDPRRSE